MHLHRLTRIACLFLVPACTDPSVDTDATATATMSPTTGSSGQLPTTGAPTTGTSTTGTPTTGTSTSSSSSSTSTTDPDPSSTSGGPTATTVPVTTETSTTDPSTDTTDSSSSTTTGEPLGDFTPLSLEVADIDGDGEHDLFVMGLNMDQFISGQLSLGLGDGTFAPALAVTTAQAASAYPAIGDLDDVPGVDVMVYADPDIMHVRHWQDGTLKFWKSLKSPSPARAHVAFDFDGDAHGDVVALWNNQTHFGLTLHRGTGNFFWPSVTTEIGSKGDTMLAPTSLLVGHLNGDLFADALMFDPNKPGLVRVFGTLSSTFTLPAILLPDLRPWVAQLADFDEDGALDLVVAEQNPPRLSIATGDGFGGFTLAVAVDIAAPFIPWALAVADLDGDGHLDLVAVDTAHPELLFWPGGGDATLGPAESTALPSGAVRVHAALLDGDAIPDLAVATFEAGDVTILLSP